MRVVIDIGMHCELPIPDEARPFHPRRALDAGARPRVPRRARRQRPGVPATASWSATSACPGQAISYKLGERVWLAGRAAARRGPRRATSTSRRWHMAALSQGSLGLDDLAAELAEL